MELPKNITQIGETDKNSKIYMEDYVVSYIKQQNKKAAERQLGIALYGKKNSEQGTAYYFIYGASRLGSISKELRHLSGAQLQEAERLRKAHFAELIFLGYCILNGDSLEGIYLYENEICRYVKGYACFYEKNDSMLSFMVENRDGEYLPEQVSRVKYEEVRDRQLERKRLFEEGKGAVSKVPEEKTEGQSSFLPIAAVLMLAVLGVSAVGYANSGELSGRLGDGLHTLQTWLGASQEEVELPAAAEHVETLVAEAQLTEAIQKENATPKPQSAEPEVSVEASQEAEAEAPAGELPETKTPTPTAAVPTAEPETPAETVQPEISASEPEQVSEVSVQQPSSEYTIQPGDTLIQICRRYYGDEGMVKTVCEVNVIGNPDNIQVGQKILLP